MEYKIELVHFQITRNCNLRCWFCGQWGRKGFFSDAGGIQMEFEDWEKIVVQLVGYREKSGVSPDIILWGGEPLLCPFFEELVNLTRRNGFRLGLITNGTMIDRYASVLKREFWHIYVSVDGNREVHNRIRGEGVFEKVAKNLELIYGGNAKISITTVISQDNLPILQELPDLFCALACDEVLLQEMITFSDSEAEAYKRWLKNCFDMDALEITSWINEAADGEKKVKALRNILNGNYSKPIRYLPHGAAGSCCKSPCSHMHIAWNGDLLYCTDFYDFKAGNVRLTPLLQIFQNRLSQKFREEIEKGRCIACWHCSWKNRENFRL